MQKIQLSTAHVQANRPETIPACSPSNLITGIARFFSLAMLLMFSSFYAFSQTNTWDGSSNNNWNTGANWSLNHVPTNTEDVVVPGGTLLGPITININTNANCKSLTVNSGVGAVTININASRSLTVVNALTMNGSTGLLTYNTLAIGDRPLTVGSIVMNSSGTSRITSGAGTIDVAGSVTMNGSSTENSISFTGAGTMNIGGDMNAGGSFSPGTSTVTLDGSATQYIGGGTTSFYNLTVNKSANTNTVYNSSNALTIANTFQVTRGVFVASATNADFTVGGNLAVSGNGTITHDVDWDSYGKLFSVAGNVNIDGKFQYLSRSHVQLVGSGTVNVRTGSNSSSSFGILTLKNGNFYASGDLRIDDNFWSMFFTSGSFHTNGQNVYANGTILNAGGTVYVDGGSLNVTSGTLIGYTTSGSMNISSGTLNTDLIYIGNGTTAGAVTHSGGTVNISSGLTLGSAGTYTCSGSPAINISGDWINNNSAGAFVPASSVVTFNNSSLVQTISGTATSQNFGNITVAKAGQTLNVSGSTTSLDLSGNLLISAGTFDVGTASNLYVAGNFTNNGTAFTPGTGRVIFDGSSAQAINGSTQTNFNNVQINNTGTGVDLSTQNLNINGTGAGALDFQNGKINTGALAVVMSGSAATITNAGSGKYVNGYLTMAVPTGTPTRIFEIGDATTYSPVNIVFNNVTVAGSVTINTVAGDYPNIITSLVDETRSVNRYWDIVNNGITVTNFSPKFVYQSPEIDAIANPLIFRIGRYTGFWSYPTIGARTATSITASVSLFGVHVVGEAATGAPTITTQPSDNTVCGGTSTTFTAAANAKPNCTAVWEYSTDGGNTFITVPLSAPYSESSSTTSNITTSVLTINPTSVSMDGYLYRAMFSNNRGSTPSFDATLYVTSEPVANAGSATSPICGSGSSAPLGGSIGGAATSGVWSSDAGGTFSPSANDLNATWTPPIGYSGTATLTLTASGGACANTTDSKTQVVASSVSGVNVSPSTSTVCVNGIQALTANNNVNVTQSSSTTVAIPNNNAAGASNTVSISGIPVGATILGISVSFNFTHPKVNDLVINLTAPNGNTINLANRLGSTGANFTSTTVNSSSTTAFSTSSPPYTGTFQASAVNGVGATSYTSNTTSFSSLYSTPNGTWRLSARDAANPNSGSLTSWSITITYSTGETITWSPATKLFTNAAATIPYTAGTDLGTVYYKSSTAETVTYTATATATSGCTSSNTTTVTTGPVINIIADYCYGGGKIQLSASSTPAATSWLWNTGATTSSILVDIAGLYSVTATTSGGCTNTMQASIAQELITNGDFSAGNTGFTSTYTYAAPAVNALYPANTYTVYSNPNYVHNNFWGRDHTTNSGNMLIVNGSGTTPPPAVWQQTVTVQPNTDYYFSAYAISLNNVAPFANLQFKVNGTQVGTTTGTLPSRATNNNPPYNYTRFYGTWNSGAATTATVAIVDLETAAGGNDFGIDDISFGTLSTFITLTSTLGTDAQTVCKNSAITPIIYNVGSGSAGPTVTGLPPGVTSSYNGVTLTISGSPTSLGTYTYTLTTTGTCNPVTSTGTITVNEETITRTSAAGTISQTACYGLPITDITYSLGGAATGATVTGLPAGVTGSVSGTTFTISGSPTVLGTYNFTVTTAGPCSHVTTTGTMTVNGPTIIRTSANGTNSQTVCRSTSIVNITYLVGGTATGATVSGLPAGVFNSYSAGVVTIYGAPAFAGTYNYTVTTTGSCGVISATGSITVTQQTISLTSAVGTNNQNVCVNNTINTIAYTVGGTATGATVSGLPAGVTSLYNVGVLTISGTPTVPGNYTYTVTTTGTCTASSVTGTINVRTQTITLTSGSASTTACKNVLITPIVYTLGGSATGATVTGLPSGVTGSVAGSTFTISGTPTVTGTFGYTITTSGTCTSTTTSGSIAIQEQTITLNTANNNQTLCANSAIASITYTLGGTATGATVSGLPTGVIGNYSAGTFTISGTPTVPGTYSYTVTGTGTCTAATATGTLTVNGQTISLSSAAGTDAQTPCLNSAITNITYTIGGSATGATITGLPSGVTGNYSAGVFTISGNPSVAGNYSYTITTSGTCSSTTATGSINVGSQTISLSSAVGTNAQTPCINTAITNITYAIGGSGTGATVTGLPSGVTGSYSAGVFTISGTPSVAGTYSYTVTTTGTCAAATANGTITVRNQTISLTSAVGTNAQTPCINTAITNITYAVGGTGTGATVTGLPTGVSDNFSGGVFTISGTPSVAGTYSYTVTTTGTCAAATASGTITVRNQTISLTSAVGTNAQTPCINTAITNITYAVGGTGTGATVTGLPTGVSGNFSGGVFTISGTPSVAGTYSYTVTTSGSCASATANGTITVRNQTISLTSAVGTNAQTPCINTAITNITYSIGGSATGATVTGLPTGITGVYSAGVFTISGIPSVAGTYSYTVTTSGACATASANGTITVRNQTISLSSAVGTNAQSLCNNTAITNITYTVGGTATGATVTGLPTGVTGNYSAGVFTISGTPSASGTFSYTVTTSGSCASATATGTITVNPTPVAGSIANVSTCYGGSGSLSLTGYTGTISSWQSSVDGGATWTTISNTTATQSFSNAQVTTLYKANVSLGGCGTVTTGNAKLGIHNLWVGSTSSDWHIATNWSDDQLPTLSCPDVIIPTVTGPAVYPVLTGGFESVNNLVIRSGASLTVTGATIKVAGAINNSGSLYMSNGSLELNGSSAQSIAGSYFNNHLLKDLIISNNNGVSLTGGVDTLKLTGTLSFGTSNALFQTNDHLTLVSNQYGTANVGDLTGNGLYSGNDISGNVTVERYIPSHPKAWQYLSAPTIGQTIKQSWQEGNGTLENAKPGYGTTIAGNVANALTQGFDFATSTPSMKVYDPSTNNWLGVASTTLPIANKKGYMLFVRGDRSVTSANGAPTALTLRTTGHLYTTGVYAPQSTSVPAGKFESIGNPYASAIDYNKLSFTGGVQDDIFYVWDPLLTIRTDAGGNSAYGYGGFQTFYWNGSSFDVTPGGGSYADGNTNIESGQAFMVYAPLSSGTVSFNESSKQNGSATVNRAPGQPYAQLRTRMFAVTQGTRILLDGNTAQFDSSFSNTVDARDALKATNTNESLGLKRDNKRLAVERHNVINTRDTLFLDMGTLKVQQYQFEFSPTLMEEPGLTAYLEDRYLNNATMISLSDTTRYTFNVINAPAAYAADRFRIVFAKTPVTVLPVNIVSVSANRNSDKTVAVRWKTESETSMSGYTVERSENGRDFEGVLTSDPKANNGGSANYAANDLTANTNQLYYRIKALSLSGQVQYSSIVKVAALSKVSEVTVYPNPVRDRVAHLQFSGMKPGDYTVVLVHTNGAVENLGRVKIEAATETKSIQLPKNTAGGVYQLKIIDADGNTIVKSIQVVE